MISFFKTKAKKWGGVTFEGFLGIQKYAGITERLKQSHKVNKITKVSFLNHNG